MSDYEDRLLADFACLDPVYVDGIFTEGVTNLGANFITPYFRWMPINTENGVRDARKSSLALSRVGRDFLARSRTAELQCLLSVTYTR